MKCAFFVLFFGSLAFFLCFTFGNGGRSEPDRIHNRNTIPDRTIPDRTGTRNTDGDGNGDGSGTDGWREWVRQRVRRLQSKGVSLVGEYFSVY